MVLQGMRESFLTFILSFYISIMEDKYDYFCLIGFNTTIQDTSCIIRRDKETESLEFCNPYRGWTENSDLRRRFLGGDNALEEIDQDFASKKVKEWQESWSYPGD